MFVRPSMLTLLIILLGVLLLGCRSAESVAQAVVAEESADVVFPTPALPAAITIQPTLSPTPLPPVVYDVSTATAPPAMVLPEESALATATPIPTATNTPVPTGTPTPPPTFTPPSLPGTSPNEHYWLWRPVPDGGAVWTDKSYPYGSTRGGTLRPHHGVEFNVPSGTAILASATGTVVVAGDDFGTAWGAHTNFYGNLIVIEHESAYRGQKVYSLYGHLSQVGVAVGQRVEAQQVIGLSGSSGVADGPHLHFEVRVGANNYASTQNPTLWLYPFRDHGTIAGRVTWPNGALVEGASVSASRIDGASAYKGTTTYIGNTINSDRGWNENFVLDDIVAGYYLVTVTTPEKRYKVETWVYPYMTSFVEFTIAPSE